MNTEGTFAPERTLYLIPYFDEDFDLNVMNALRKQGYAVYCARDEGMTEAKSGKRISDAEQLAFAVSHV